MEDINYIDAAADNLIPEDHRSSAYYIAKADGVVCGIEVAKRVFDLAGGNVDFRILMKDGSKVKKGDNGGKHSHSPQRRTHRSQSPPAYVRHRYRYQQMC